MDAYPHELSGGMCQRVIIAMAVCGHPKLIIADEPTTALDVTVQAQVLELLKDLQKKLNTAILLITHNLGVVWEMCDTVMVMYAGNTVEYADTKTLYQEPLHPYTWGLLDSMPKLSSSAKEDLKTIPGTPPDLRLTGYCCNFYNRCPYATEICKNQVPPLKEVAPGHFVACHRQDGEHRLTRGEVNEDMQKNVIMSVDHLSKDFVIRGKKLGEKNKLLHALSDVSFDIYEGETLGIIGESGCGKSTLGRCLVKLHKPSGGTITYNGKDLWNMPVYDREAARRDIQMIFQDPYSSLDPRKTASYSIEEAMKVHHIGDTARERRQKALEYLQEVGLDIQHMERYPHEFSGGQRQRVNIARALTRWGAGKIIVCDEAGIRPGRFEYRHRSSTSSAVCRSMFNLTYVFISHDLGIIKYISDRIMIMYLGRVMEFYTSEGIYADPKHPYTQALLSAIPPESPFGEKRAPAAHRRYPEPDRGSGRLPARRPLPALHGSAAKRRSRNSSTPETDIWWQCFFIRITCLMPSHAEFSVQKIPIREKTTAKQLLRLNTFIKE